MRSLRFVSCTVLSGCLLTASVSAAGPVHNLSLSQVEAGSYRDEAGGNRPLRNVDIRLIVGLGAVAAVSKQFENAESMARTIDGIPLEGVVDIADRYGEGTTAGLTALSLLAIGELAGDGRLSAAGRDMSTSLLATWAVVWAVKVTVNARRPNGGRYSFPSGHTATAFAMAPVVHRRFGARAGYTAYALATVTALARMEDQKHYLADVLVGGALGIVIGREVASESEGRVLVEPAGRGLGLTVRF